MLRDPRGYDSTKWHHLDCFFSLDSVPVSSTETIEGFSELTGSDQDKLKQMVSEGDQSSTKGLCSHTCKQHQKPATSLLQSPCLSGGDQILHPISLLFLVVAPTQPIL